MNLEALPEPSGRVFYFGERRGGTPSWFRCATIVWANRPTLLWVVLWNHRISGNLHFNLRAATRCGEKWGLSARTRLSLTRVLNAMSRFTVNAKIKGVNSSEGNELMVTEVRCSSFPLSLMFLRSR